jgi:hypothetical protein
MQNKCTTNNNPGLKCVPIVQFLKLSQVADGIMIFYQYFTAEKIIFKNKANQNFKAYSF